MKTAPLSARVPLDIEAEIEKAIEITDLNKTDIVVGVLKKYLGPYVDEVIAEKQRSFAAWRKNSSAGTQ